jgi:hypothetical protein
VSDDPKNGAVVVVRGNTAAPETVGSVVDDPAAIYANVGNAVLSPQERAVLDQPVEIDRVCVRDDGMVFVPHEWHRTRLRQSVGCGSFGTRILRVWDDPAGEDTILFVRLALFIRGSLVATAIGSHRYRKKTEKRLDLSKKMGLGVEPWMPSFRKAFLRDHCIRVTVKDNTGRYVSKWRLKTDDPLDGEMPPSTPTQDNKQEKEIHVSN